MKILIEIPDKKASFLFELLRQLPFVKNVVPLTQGKAEIMEGIKESVDEFQLIRQGKLKAISAKKLLDEL